MKVFLIAGEPSGDRLGAALMGGLRALGPDIAFAGIGGPLMQAEGLASQFPMGELSVMGIAEVLPKYFHLKRRIREAAEGAIAWGADIVLTIDSPDFGLRVQRLIKDHAPGIRRMHYVAPSVWAWRPGRAAKMAEVVEHVLAILPFEPPLMQAAGMSCDFVGHPVVAERLATEEEARDFRIDTGIGDAPLLLCLPGSRKGEVTRLAARFGETVALLGGAMPGLRVVVPTVANVAPLVRDLTAGWANAPIIVEGVEPKRAAFAAADMALAASGTVSLELAANRLPMVIGYDMAPLSRWLIGRLMRIDTVTLVNLVSETRAVPEFLGRACQPAPMAEALAGLTQPAIRDAQIKAMDITMTRLGQGGEPPGLRAARSVIGAFTARL